MGARRFGLPGKPTPEGILTAIWLAAVFGRDRAIP